MNNKLTNIAAMALALLHSAGVPAQAIANPYEHRKTPDRKQNRNDAEAIRKAAEKRARKEAKRAREVQP